MTNFPVERFFRSISYWLVNKASRSSWSYDNGGDILTGSFHLRLLLLHHHSVAFDLFQTRSTRFIRVNVVGGRDAAFRWRGAVQFDNLFVNALLFLSDWSWKGVQHLQFWITSFHHQCLHHKRIWFGNFSNGRWSRMDQGRFAIVAASSFSTGADAVNAD